MNLSPCDLYNYKEVMKNDFIFFIKNIAPNYRTCNHCGGTNYINKYNGNDMIATEIGINKNVKYYINKRFIEDD